MDACCYTNPGCKAQEITYRVPDMCTGVDNDFVVLAGSCNNIPDESVDKCIKNIGCLVACSLACNPKSHVILPGIPYRYDQPMLNAKIDKVNEILKSKCDAMDNVIYLQQTYVDSDYKRDGLHFNSVGQKKFASFLKQAIFSTSLHNTSRR